ncbi:multicopper oxidase [Dorcoceras hygrometricum]|uniref:Multicopper oxidase n=1 Tax=Dorcoceras hygrometricum TaxID=472368 RepID=A0A2Z7BA94_9LAMI|nr:multicopper oxidase [Dorcoceras hygrometricum]
MQHAILQVMKCMMAIKGIGHQGQRLSWKISSEPLHHAQPISRWKSSVRDLQAHHPSQFSGLQSRNQLATTPMIAFDPSGATTQSADQNAISTQVINRISGDTPQPVIHMLMPKAVYKGSIRTSNQLKSQSDLTRARHKQSAQVCFLTGSRQAQPKLPGSSNLPKQLASQLKTKRILLTAYCQGSRLLTKALLALTKLEWEESLTQKLKSERGKPSTGIHEDIRTCNYFVPLPQVDLQLQLVSIERAKQDEPNATNLAPNNGGNRRSEADRTNAPRDLITSGILNRTGLLQTLEPDRSK